MQQNKSGVLWLNFESLFFEYLLDFSHDFLH